ncbi:MAG: FtsX-like permease family protein, partial [Candidatus Moranbacteria bacterium]|nr:FtsX-like permease family protein [Candidatus Moranbacteria bacterium]
QILTGKKDSQGIPDFTEKKYYVKGIIEDETQAYAYIDRSSAEEISFDNYDKIKIKVSSDDKLEEVRENVINKGYYVSAISDLVEQAKQIFKISQIILSLFGIVALIVSAIGMFNTMTIALLERTQEIGIMKTLGASSSVIWRVFLVESIAIGFSGGVLGILLGYVGGHISNFGINILARNFGGTEVDLFYIPVWFVFFILIFSILVGAFTGFYPARRASKLNALEALRYK